jgi:hypothetical protein
MDSLLCYNDLSGPIIGVVFSDKLNHYQPFKKDPFELDRRSMDITNNYDYSSSSNSSSVSSMALGSTQPLTKMSTRNIPGG